MSSSGDQNKKSLKQAPVRMAKSKTPLKKPATKSLKASVPTKCHSTYVPSDSDFDDESDMTWSHHKEGKHLYIAQAVGESESEVEEVEINDNPEEQISDDSLVS